MNNRRQNITESNPKQVKLKAVLKGRNFNNHLYSRLWGKDGYYFIIA